MKQGLPPPSSHYDSAPSSPTSETSSDGEEVERPGGNGEIMSIGADDGYHRALRALIPREVAILRLSRRTYDECLPLLYSKNRFTFHTDAVTTYWWLRARSERVQSLIRHLGLSKRCMMMPEIRGGRVEPLRKLIILKMQLSTLTVWALETINPLYEYETTLTNWYPQATSFLELLLNGNIKYLRLMFAVDDYISRMSLDFKDCGHFFEPIFLPQEIDVGGIHAVKRLSDLVLESHNYEEFMGKRLLELGREDCCGGDEGTVVVLRSSNAGVFPVDTNG